MIAVRVMIALLTATARNAPLRGDVAVAFASQPLNGPVHILAQRIDRQGRALWGAGGALKVGTSGLHGPVVPAMCADGADGVYIAYRCALPTEQGRQQRTGISVVRLDRNGAPVWKSGPTVLPMDTYVRPMIVSAGRLGVIVACLLMNLPGGDMEVLAQRIAPDGRPQWGDHGRPLTVAAGRLDRVCFQGVSDGRGGVILFFARPDERDTTILAQRVDRRGTLLWRAGGVPAVDPARPRRLAHPVVACDGAEGAIIACDLREADGCFGVAVERLSTAGKRLWDVGTQITSRSS